jgi:hypothetical protein
MSNPQQKSASVAAAYPSREEHNRRWEELAREIAADRKAMAENPHLVSQNKQGSLIILGSGIQGIGFTREAEAYLKAADKVFYCVSNPPSQVWLHEMRADAYDLYVLYNDTKPRFNTYMQMSEAMLHYVRKGMRVVGVYYGHPGIFVLSTHRAIAIARREGYNAVMKPGISALDCLCADLGVDPAYPGMQTFEASEVLLRKRRLDTTVHVVLWQVGLIGEQGYRRKGFINDKFPILVEYLQEYYGADYEVTHYIGARHATFEPTKTVHKLSDMLNPRVRATFTGISTFYIPPKDAAQTDLEMAARLGFVVGPRQKLSKLTPVRDIASYSAKELAALDEFATFKVPNEYQYQPKTRAGEFLVELNHNVALQDLYRQDPQRAVSDESFPGLSSLEKNLLATRNENHAHVAAKGSLASYPVNERFIIDLHKEMALASAFYAHLIASYRRPDAEAAINAWIIEHGYEGASLEFFTEANDHLKAALLLSWTGIYATADQSLVLTVIGSPDMNDLSLVYANLTPITGFTFNNSTLIWRAEDGNPNSAKLVFKVSDEAGEQGFRRALSGKYWTRGAAEPAEDNLQALEVLPGGNPLSVWTARYATQVTADGTSWEEGPAITVVTPRPDQSPNQARLMVGTEPIEAAHFADNTIKWGNNRITFAQDGQTSGGKALSGTLEGYWPGGVNLRGASLVNDDAPFRGRYLAFVFEKNRWSAKGELDFEAEAVHIGGKRVEGAVFNHHWLRWSGAGGNVSQGEIQFSIDPTTQLPKFVGYVWGREGKPKNPNIQGTYALEMNRGASPEREPVGRFTTAIRLADGTFGPGGPVVEVTGADTATYGVTISDGSASLRVDNASFDQENAVLSWRHRTAAGSLSEYANADLRFSKNPLTGAVVFSGSYWQGEAPPPPASENWRGHALGVRPPVPVGETQVPARVFEVLGTIGLEGSNATSLFIWSQWQRACFTSRLASRFVPKICEAIAGNKPGKAT